MLKMEALGSSRLLVCSVTFSYHTQIAVGMTARNHVIFMNPTSGFITDICNDNHYRCSCLLHIEINGVHVWLL